MSIKDTDTAGPQWVPLHEAHERLFRYRGDFTRLELNDVLNRGRVPVLAMRGDIVATLPDQVEDLLAKASSINVASENNAILAEYQIASAQDVRQVFGEHSTLADPEPRWLPLIIKLDFVQVRVCWATLIGELRRVGWGPADEAAFRKLDLWPDSREPVGGGPGLMPAPPAEIHKAITAAYDTAEAAGEKPPNIKEITKSVQERLLAGRYEVSDRQIQKLADESQHKARRRKSGKTVASERHSQEL